VINCAASVKHFARGNEIEKTNLESVRNLIRWCLEHEARLVHVSTESIFGHPSQGCPRAGLIYDEHMLYVGQIYEDNQYVRSKFLAERLIYENILDKGLHAKVLRAGNLAPRSSDGHFQINADTNNYMNTLKGFGVLGCLPYEAAVASTEFSPIDKVAEALLLLAQTPAECVCFMMSNIHRPLMGDVIDSMRSYGCSIRYVEQEEFAQALQAALADPEKWDAMRPFMAYAQNDPKAASSLTLDDLSVSYTAQILARLGFAWPACGEEYCQKFLRAFKGLK
jgi:thioester reductase-like protein